MGTELDVDINASRTAARVANDTGATDFALSVATPAQTAYPAGARVSTLTSDTWINGAWHSTLSQTNVLSAGRVRFPRNVDLQVGQGRMADDLRSLKPVKTVQLNVTTEGQLAPHMPVPTSVRPATSNTIDPARSRPQPNSLPRKRGGNSRMRDAIAGPKPRQ